MENDQIVKENREKMLDYFAKHDLNVFGKLNGQPFDIACFYCDKDNGLIFRTK